jgi:sRNA-binding regulator protein Hfq
MSPRFDTPDSDIRAQQAQEGRRLASGEGQRRIITARKPMKKTAKPVGHEGYLKGLQESGAQIVVMTLAGDLYEGRIKHADKYTISLEVEEDGSKDTYVFFKHALEYFRPLTPPPAQKEDQSDVNPGLTD